MNEQVKVTLDVRAFQKLRTWVEMARGEVSGLGLVREVRELNGTFAHFWVEDLFLIQQQSGATETALDDEAVGEFLTERVRAGEDVSPIRLWWHSHGDLKTFWSATDESCIRRLANSSYMLSIVTNKEGQMLARVDIYQPFHITVNDLATEVFYPKDKVLTDACAEEFRAKVREHSSVIAATQCDAVQNRFEPVPAPACEPLLEEEINRLEELVNRGRMSLEEYEDRVQQLVFDEAVFDSPF